MLLIPLWATPPVEDADADDGAAANTKEKERTPIRKIHFPAFA